VETFQLRLLKAKGFPASDVPNCEGSVSFMADTLSDEPGDIRSYYTIAGGVVF